MSQITPTFLFLSVALLIWSLAAGVSSYLAQDFAREHGVSAQGAANIEALKTAAAERPKDIETQMQLAGALVGEALRTSNGGILMEAVRAFSHVLDLEPEHPGALLGLAKVCLDAGIIDKALELYPRYLKQRPEDLQAKTDFALALLRGGQAAEAKTKLDEVLAVQPSAFPAQITLALVYRELGDIAQAKEAAQKAQDLAPDPEVKQQVAQFMKSLDAPSGEAGAAAGSDTAADSVTAAAPRADETVSAAMQIERYFTSHSIIGPKLQRVTWPAANRAEVMVADFPVQQMPPFAKAKFLENVKTAFAAIPESITIVLKDAASGEELLSIPVGGDTAGGGGEHS
ncbi:MAG: tetratricopeptide repeat protein [Bdellovibrionales bacterium]|nr:tetratricopeptide repeat protein [Bdellovibrionales bacterium]